MARKRKRGKKGRKEATPITAAGLIRFYDEDVSGVKISPGFVLFLSMVTIALVLLANARLLPI